LQGRLLRGRASRSPKLSAKSTRITSGKQNAAAICSELHPTCKRVLESLLGIIQHDQTAMLCLERMVVIELPGVDNREVRRAVLRQNLFETSDHFLNLLSD
jgi:hypothetical protein